MNPVRNKSSSPGEDSSGAVLFFNGHLTRAGKKLLILSLIAVVCMLIIHLTGLREHLANVHELKARLRLMGLWAPLVFTLSVTLLVAAGTPRLILSALGGFAFGFTQGFVWSMLGSLLGSYLTFLLAKWGGRDWVEARLRAVESDRIRNLIENPTILSVFLIRQVPVTVFLNNLLLGVTSVGTWTFLAGSALGFLPGALVVTLIGSGLSKDSASTALLQITIALVCAALILAIALMKKGRWSKM